MQFSSVLGFPPVPRSFGFTYSVSFSDLVAHGDVPCAVGLRGGECVLFSYEGCNCFLWSPVVLMPAVSFSRFRDPALCGCFISWVSRDFFFDRPQRMESPLSAIRAHAVYHSYRRHRSDRRAQRILPFFLTEDLVTPPLP